MQTPAERRLVDQVCGCLGAGQHDGVQYPILNVGAGKSLSIEKAVFSRGLRYACDRVDMEDCAVAFPTVRHCWTCSVEDMSPLHSSEYCVAFANYVLEHVHDIDGACREIYRVLRPGGLFVASVPNPTASEFLLAKYTPLWLHRAIKQAAVWKTEYSYHSIAELAERLEREGFVMQNAMYWPVWEAYLYRYPVFGRLGRLYDRMVCASDAKRWMGDVCITVRKPS